MNDSYRIDSARAPPPVTSFFVMLIFLLIQGSKLSERKDLLNSVSSQCWANNV